MKIRILVICIKRLPALILGACLTTRILFLKAIARSLCFILSENKFNTKIIKPLPSVTPMKLHDAR
ncbi:TPA: hypothetical protein ACGZCP_005428, partial [Citrobacter freundii]|nr:hypothetical protein [Klebsiella michiganensis]